MDINKDFSIKELFSKLCNADRKKLLIFFYVGSLLVHLIYFSVSGVCMMGSPEEDMDSYFFINAANMLTSDFSGFINKYAGMPYYWCYILFLGIMTAIFGENYIPVIIFQIILNSASVPMLYLAVEKISDDRRIPFASSFVYMLYLSCVRWSVFIASDFLGAGFMPVCLYFLFSYLKEEDTARRNKYLIKLLISLAAYFTMRTVAVPFIVGVLIILIWNKGRKTRIIAGGILAAVLAAVVLVLLNSGEELHSLMQNLDFFTGLYANGDIVNLLYNYVYAEFTEVGTASFYLNCLVIIFYRFFYYWTSIDVGINNGRFRPRVLYSVLHYLPNVYVFGSMFLGMIIAKFRKDKESSFIRAISGLIWFCCIVQIICEINIDWRYRDIIMPMCIIVCAYGTIRMYDMLKSTSNIPQSER